MSGASSYRFSASRAAARAPLGRIEWKEG